MANSPENSRGDKDPDPEDFSWLDDTLGNLQPLEPYEGFWDDIRQEYARDAEEHPDLDTSPPGSSGEVADPGDFSWLDDLIADEDAQEPHEALLDEIRRKRERDSAGRQDPHAPPPDNGNPDDHQPSSGA